MLIICISEKQARPNLVLLHMLESGNRIHRFIFRYFIRDDITIKTNKVSVFIMLAKLFEARLDHFTVIKFPRFGSYRSSVALNKRARF